MWIIQTDTNKLLAGTSFLYLGGEGLSAKSPSTTLPKDHECELSESQQKLYKAAQEAFQQLPSRDDKFARHNHIFSMLQAVCVWLFFRVRC